MKVKGTQTTTQLIDVEVNDSEIKRIVDSQDKMILAEAIQQKLLNKFFKRCLPSIDGEIIVRKDAKAGNRGTLVFVHVDADWDHHNNVGVDKEIRSLTHGEVVLYENIRKLPEYIMSLDAGWTNPEHLL